MDHTFPKGLSGFLCITDVPCSPFVHPQHLVLGFLGPGSLLWGRNVVFIQKLKIWLMQQLYESQFLFYDPPWTWETYLWCDKPDCCSSCWALPSASCFWGKFNKVDNEHWGNNRSSFFSWAVVGLRCKYFMSIIHSEMLWKFCVSSWFSCRYSA